MIGRAIGIMPGTAAEARLAAHELGVTQAEARAMIARTRGGRPTPRVQESQARLPECPECGSPSMAWIGDVCSKCTNSRTNSRQPSRRTTPTPTPLNPRAEADRAEGERFVVQGVAEILGDRHLWNPWTLAKTMNIAIEFADIATMANDPTLLGAYDPKTRTVWLQNTLTESERAEVLGHELGHASGLDTDPANRTGYHPLASLFSESFRANAYRPPRADVVAETRGNLIASAIIKTLEGRSAAASAAQGIAAAMRAR